METVGNVAESGDVQYAPVEADLNIWNDEEGKPKFVILRVGDFLFVPPCSEARFGWATEQMPKSVIDPNTTFFRSQKVWEQFCVAYGSKEARSAYADRAALGPDRITHIVDRDLLRLTGGYSESWKRDFPGGNPFTGYVIINLARNQDVLGRMACGSGYKPTEDPVSTGFDDITPYKAEPWTHKEEETIPVAHDRGSAELQIGDAIDTRLQEQEFTVAYRTCILASVVLANHFCGRARQDGVLPRRLTITLIDPARCVVHNELTAEEKRILGIKKDVLEALGFTIGGYLYPKSAGMPVDPRNYDDHTRVVYIMDTKQMAACVAKHVKVVGVVEKDYA